MIEPAGQDKCTYASYAVALDTELPVTLDGHTSFPVDLVVMSETCALLTMDF